MILAGVFLLCGLIASCFLGEPRRLTALFIATAAVEPVHIAPVGSLCEPNKVGKKPRVPRDQVSGSLTTVLAQVARRSVRPAYCTC